MDYRYKQLEQDLSALSNVFSDLASRLSEAGKDVTASGVLPSEKLIEQILTARTKFESVRTAIHSQAAAMLVSPLPKAADLVSIQGIGGLLKIAANAEESKFSAQGELEQVTHLLSRVLAITHRETAGFQPLLDCQAKVTELRNAISNMAWPNRHPEADSIIALRHPSTVLLNFVENLDTLEDDKWIALEATITEAYGKPLFVAASRGKLVAQQPARKAPEPVRTAPIVEKAVEKPVEKKPAPEKLSEKTIAPPAVTAHLEAKEAPVAPAHVTHAPPAAPPPVAPGAVAQTTAPAPVVAPPAPAPITPITSTTIPPRPPAPVAAPPMAVATPAAPAPTSLSALANATEPATERKPAGTAPSESADKSRKEPRLATPPAPQPARTESAEQEQEHRGDESGAMAGDGQRPQRWGFWRGNR